MDRRTRREAGGRQPEKNSLQNVEKEKQEPEEEVQGTSLFHQCMSLRELTHSEDDMVRKISHIR